MHANWMIEEKLYVVKEPKMNFDTKKTCYIQGMIWK